MNISIYSTQFLRSLNCTKSQEYGLALITLLVLAIYQLAGTDLLYWHDFQMIIFLFVILACLFVCFTLFMVYFFFLSLDEKWYLHISEGSGRCWELIGVTYIKLQNINGAIRKRRQLTWNLWTDIRSIMGSFKNSNKETE